MTDKLLSNYGWYIESFEIIPASKGKFEFAIDGELVYSKLATGRHATWDEIRREIDKRLND
ncbi:MAG: hypothetical protein HUU60_04290 [Armatimonadetes bacterium]|nr:hypothetical protein [Armatimonadota bacterium]